MAYINGNEVLFSAQVSISETDKATMVGLIDGSLTEIDIPYGVTSISAYRFYNFTKLKRVTIPNSVTSIGTQAFAAVGLESIEIPSSVDKIISYAFYSCSSLKSVVFKGKPTSIDSKAFTSCRVLESIECPWKEGEVANAPWGATTATILYTG